MGRVCPRRAAAVAAILASLTACRGEAPPAESPRTSTSARGPRLSAAPFRADVDAQRERVDPTVRGARFFPDRRSPTAERAAQPGGAERALVSGVRLLLEPDGTRRAAMDLLAAVPNGVAEVPRRLGGGFLFAASRRIWRADDWLAPVRLLANAPEPVERLLVGLDRVYLRLAGGSMAALDARSGEWLALGPVPATPRLASVVALDAWHALALADLRGLTLTKDAGATWRRLPFGAQPLDIVALAEGFAVAARGNAGQLEWWRVPPDATNETDFDRIVSAAPSASVAPRKAPVSPGDSSGSVFGVEALTLAVEDGWPLADGTALVARDGALVRIRLADGKPLARAEGAFPLASARCLPLSLAVASDPAAFGFACFEPLGRTVVYSYSPEAGRLVELRAFAEPRQVLAFGNGALAVGGPCDTHGLPDLAPSAREPWCAMSPGRRWAERWVPRGARLVILADGRSVVLVPPAGGEGSKGEIAVLEGDALELRRPLEWAPATALSADVVRLLHEGAWSAAFEERRPGWIGGWVELARAGSLLGVEVSVGGELRVGEYVREAGNAAHHGRYGLAWTGSRRGFETLDGGMTWNKAISVPDPLAPTTATASGVSQSPTAAVQPTPACGPVGCHHSGWLRVGWGDAGATGAQPDLPPGPKAQSAEPPLRLRCEPLAMTRAVEDDARAPPAQATPVGSGRSIPNDDVVRIAADVSLGVGPGRQGIPLARVTVQGREGPEWPATAEWQVRWTRPWAYASEVRTSSSGEPPWTAADAARSVLGPAARQHEWTIVTADDPDAALLVFPRSVPPFGGSQVALLEADRPATVVALPGHADGAVRIGGRWFVAGAMRGGDAPSATVVWAVDGSGVRELARLPRVGGEPAHARLGKEPDDGALGIVVEGQPAISEPPALWVARVDRESGRVSDPVPLAFLQDGPARACSPVDAGWRVEEPYARSVDVDLGGGSVPTLTDVTVRMRLSASGGCIEGVLGAIGREAAVPPPALLPSSPARVSPPSGAQVLPATIFSAKTHFHLRCWFP